MISVSRSTRFGLLLAGVAVLAAGYAINYLELEKLRSAVAIFTDLSSNARFLTFVAIPLGLISIAIAVRRASTPLRLIRYGSRELLLFGPLWRLLSALVIVAGTVSITWMVMMFGVNAKLDSIVGLLQILGASGGATALFAMGFAAAYWILLAIVLITDSVLWIGLTAILLWMVALLPSVGVFMEPHPLNFPQYLTLRAVAERPQLVVALFLIVVLLFLGCRAIAQWRDFGADSLRLRTAGATFAFVLLLGLAGVLTSSPSALSSDGALLLLFQGSGGSLVAYLPGMTIVLMSAIGSTTRFGLDWTTRSALLWVRHGTLQRFTIQAILQASSRICRVLALLAVFMICVRYATTGQYPLEQIGFELLVLVRVMIVTILIATLLVLSVIMYRSEVAPLCVSGIILSLGIVPLLNKPWNPLMAWSASWRGIDAIVATASVAAGFLVIILAATAFLIILRRSKVFLVSHQY